MNTTTYCKYLKETLEEGYERLRNNVAKNSNNNLVNLDEEIFLRELKKVYPIGYESWEEDFKKIINKKKGHRNN